METPPTPPEMRARFSESRVARICSIIVLSVAVAWSAILTFCVFYQLPKFRDMFVDMGVQLPFMTQIALSHTFALGLPMFAFLSILKEILIENRTATLIMNGVYLLLVMLFQGFYLVALFLPLITLMQKMGG